MNWIQRFLTAIATHKADVSAHHAKTVIADLSPIALADLNPAVCSKTEAQGKVDTHAGVSDAHHAPVKMATGGYTGDGNNNHAIAHGLGVVPKIVIIIGVTDGDQSIAVINNQAATSLVSTWRAEGVDLFSVTAMNSTNFYVGSDKDQSWSVNGVGKDYKWWAVG